MLVHKRMQPGRQHARIHFKIRLMCQHGFGEHDGVVVAAELIGWIAVCGLCEESECANDPNSTKGRTLPIYRGKKPTKDV